MRFLTTALMLLGVMAAGFAADEVKLKNGDRVTGKVLGLVKGKLTIETTYAGKVVVDWAQVVSVQTDAPQKFKLVTGELIEGKVGPGAEGRLKIDTAGAAAPIEVDLAKVQAVNEPPTTWHGKISAAAKSQDGNSHSTSFLINVEAIRDSEQDTILMRALFRYEEDSGVLTERNGYGIGKYQYKLGPTFYAYISEELLSDTFKDLRFQTVTSVGMGRDMVKEDWIDWSLEAGIAYVTNDHNIEPDESHLGLRLATRFRVALPLGFEFKDLFTLYTNFEESQDFQLRNEATLGTVLGGGWDLLGGVITEYDRTPSPGDVRRDDTYFVGLGYTF